MEDPSARKEIVLFLNQVTAFVVGVLEKRKRIEKKRKKERKTLVLIYGKLVYLDHLNFIPGDCEM